MTSHINLLQPGEPVGRTAVTTVSHRTVRRRKREQPVFLTETPDLRKASVVSSDTWDITSDIYRSSDEEEGDNSDNPKRLAVGEVLKVLYEKECKRLGVCPVGAFLRAPGRSSLVLKNYSLGPKGAAALAVPLLLDSSVTSVDLEGNTIGPEGLRSLVGAFLESNYITSINLANNKIGHHGAILIKQLLLGNFYIVHINVSENKFTDMDADVFAQVIKENKHLKEMVLSKNSFGEYGGKIFGQEIASNDSLELLDLSWNQIRGKGAIAVANAVKENVGLKVLRLEFNGFASEGGSAMGQALTSNRTLRELDLSNNRITDTAVKDIAGGLAANDGLETLKIGVNPFQLPSALALIEAIKRNESGALRVLDLKDVCVTVEFLDALDEIKDSRDFTCIYGLRSKIRLIKPEVVTHVYPDTEGATEYEGGRAEGATEYEGDRAEGANDPDGTGNTNTESMGNSNIQNTSENETNNKENKLESDSESINTNTESSPDNKNRADQKIDGAADVDESVGSDGREGREQPGTKDKQSTEEQVGEDNTSDETPGQVVIAESEAASVLSEEEEGNRSEGDQNETESQSGSLPEKDSTDQREDATPARSGMSDDIV